MSIIKYGAMESEVSKTAERREDAEQQRKTAERKQKAHEVETRKITRKPTHGVA